MKALGLIVAALAFTGCAANAPHTTEPQTASIAFPKRVTGGDDLPTVRRLNRAIETRHDGQVNAQVRICVAPDGQVASAELLSSSGLADYDRELLTAVESWTFEPYAAPAETRVCERLDVSYRAG